MILFNCCRTTSSGLLKACTSTFQLFLLTSGLLCLFFLQRKAILSVGDKHRPDAPKHKKEVWDRKGFLQPTLFPWSHVLFEHWGGGGISCFTSSCRKALPLHCLLLSFHCTPAVKKSIECALHLSGRGLCCHKKQREEGKELAELVVRSAFPRSFHVTFFFSGLLISLTLSTDVTLLHYVYHDPHYTSVVFFPRPT